MNPTVGNSQVVSGGLLLMLSGALLATFRKLPEQLWAWLKMAFTITLLVRNSDPLFDQITIWLNQHPYSHRARRLTASSNAASEDDSLFDPAGILFSPAPGGHLLRYCGRHLWLTRLEEKNQPGSDGLSRRRTEYYEFKLVGRAPGVMRELVAEVQQTARAQSRERVAAYLSVHGYWARLRSYIPRRIESVILPAGQVEELLADVRRFLAARAWYAAMGIPYHRGYLFKGLSGTGKTSLIAALAGELRLDLYVLSLGGLGMSDEQLTSLLQMLPPNAMLLMEDADAVLPSRLTPQRAPAAEPTSTPGKAETFGVTLSGLLNCMDGFLAKDGGLVFMTTNHAERLDPALVRPGRIDYQLDFGYATGAQLLQLHRRFFPEAGRGAGYAFERDCGAECTMAEAQQRLMTEWACAEAAEARLAMAAD